MKPISEVPTYHTPEVVEQRRADAAAISSVMNPPDDKWADVKAAHARGEKIECRNATHPDAPWLACSKPKWLSCTEYRIAPPSPVQPAGKLTDERDAALAKAEEMIRANRKQHTELERLRARLAALEWRGLDVKPTKEDIDKEGYVNVTDGRCCHAWEYDDWSNLPRKYFAWLPFSPPPVPSAEEVSRKEFEAAFRHEFPQASLSIDERFYRIWQAARAEKEGSK